MIEHVMRKSSSRIEFHYTPKHGSYLNIGEIEINVLDIQSTKRWFEFQEELEKNVKKREKGEIITRRQ